MKTATFSESQILYILKEAESQPSKARRKLMRQNLC